MSYLLKSHPKVIKFLEKCEKLIAKRIRNKFEGLKADPFIYLEHFENQNFYKLRIGEYRALVEVDISRRIIFIRYLDHRKRIYKK